MVKRQSKLALHRETVQRLDAIQSEDFKKIHGGIESSCFTSDCCMGPNPILF